MPSTADPSSSYFSHWDNPASHLAYLEDEALVSTFRQAIKNRLADPAHLSPRHDLTIGSHQTPLSPFLSPMQCAFN